MFIQATLDPFLATSQLLPYRGVHSKTLLVLGEWTLSQSIKRRCTPRVFEFFHAASKIPAPRFAWLRPRSKTTRAIPHNHKHFVVNTYLFAQPSAFLLLFPRSPLHCAVS